MDIKTIKNRFRKLDNTAKVFSIEEKKHNNTFRLSVFLKEKVDRKKLKEAIKKTLEMYPSFKLKLKSGFFWDSLERNKKKPLLEEEQTIPCKSINLKKNNEYLFKVSYLKNKVNLDICHILTDGMGATILLKSLIYNYLNLKYNLSNKEKLLLDNGNYQDEYIKNYNKNIKCKEKIKKPFLIKNKNNLDTNKTYHYTINLKKFKMLCKKYNASISEFLTAFYIYVIYKTIYKKNLKKANKDIIVAVPVDLRRHYKVESFSNFFTCMNIEANVLKVKNINFMRILSEVQKQFKTKLKFDNLQKYLSRDVKLGTNKIISAVPLFIKKSFMKYCENFISQSTTTLSNIGPIKIEEQYKKYIDNIRVLVNGGRVQKAKCTICSYENNLNITLNSNIIDDNLEKEFYKNLIKYIGKVKLEK